MSPITTPIATPWNESSGTCACCGHVSKTIWGDLSVNQIPQAVYYVHWTVDRCAHDVCIDLVMGPWGDGTQPRDRFLVAVRYQPSKTGGSFMVVDGEPHLSAKNNVAGRAMKRAEVVGMPLAQEVFQLLDAVWLTDPRIVEVAALCDLVQGDSPDESTRQH